MAPAPRRACIAAIDLRAAARPASHALVSPPASYSGMSGRAGAAAMAAPAAHVAASAARARNVAVILRLPDRDALVGRDVHLVARLHAERVVERGLVHRR